MQKYVSDALLFWLFADSSKGDPSASSWWNSSTVVWRGRLRDCKPSLEHGQLKCRSIFTVFILYMPLMQMFFSIYVFIEPMDSDAVWK